MAPHREWTPRWRVLTNYCTIPAMSLLVLLLHKSGHLGVVVAVVCRWVLLCSHRIEQKAIISNVDSGQEDDMEEERELFNSDLRFDELAGTSASYLMFSFVWWSSPAQRIISFSNQGKIYGLIEMCGEEKGPVLFRVSEADADRRNGLSWGFCERRKISSSVSNPQMKIILRSTFLSWLIEIVIFVFGRLLGLYHFNYLIPDDVCLLAADDQWWWGLYN